MTSVVYNGSKMLESGLHQEMYSIFEAASGAVIVFGSVWLVVLGWRWLKKNA